MSTRWLRCTEPFVDMFANRARRAVGDEWEAPTNRARKLAGGPLCVMLQGPGMDPVPEPENVWEDLAGRDLRTVYEAETGARVVACLNVWDDLPALQETMPTWYDHVDAVIAVDGAYAGAPALGCASTDGTLEYLEQFEKVTIIRAPEVGFWPDQVTKRNRYFEVLHPDEIGFVVDADEFVGNAEALQHLGPLDVGWVPYRKHIYHKAQNFPRLFRGAIQPQYNGRHYWLTGRAGRITDCQIGGAGYDHVFVPVTIDNEQGKRMRSAVRRANDTIIRSVQQKREAAVDPTTAQSGRESLRIAQIAPFDAGMVVFRLHTAINATTPHTSVMCALDADYRVYQSPRQYDLHADRGTLRKYLADCDIVHCHLHYQAWDTLGIRTDAPTIIHHHGTMFREYVQSRNRQDARRAAVRLVSNPELTQYADDLHYLPNPVPVARYKRLREKLYRPDPDGWFRVGHSPSKRELKGTEDFLDAVERMRKAGVKIRPVLIENTAHAECLRIKAAECDAFFDSFWLGMQCSGIEAAAMGMPVIAGDAVCEAWYRQTHGDTPYVYADSGPDLVTALVMLNADREYMERRAQQVHEYVTQHHDYAAVTARYLDILDETLDWRSRLRLGRERFLRY